MLAILGLDKQLLHNCPARERGSFELAALIALLNGSIAGVGAGYLVFLIFQHSLLSILGGIAWALVFLNLQRFLFLSQDPSPMRWATFCSLLFKLLILGFFAVVMAFPVMMLLSRETLAPELAERIAQRHQQVSEQVYQQYRQSEQALEDLITEKQQSISSKQAVLDTLSKQYAEQDSQIAQDTILSIIQDAEQELIELTANSQLHIEHARSQLQQLRAARQQELDYYARKIAASRYLIESGHILLTHDRQRTLGQIAIICLLFWLPILMRRGLGPRSHYEQRKQAVEQVMILQYRESFIARYETIVKDLGQKDYSYPRQARYASDPTTVSPHEPT